MAAAARDIPALVRRLRAGPAAGQVAAARELARLAAVGPQHKDAILAAGGAAALMQLLGTGVEEEACWALAPLAQGHPGIQAAAVAAGAVPRLLRCLRSCQPAAACCLAGLTTSRRADVAAALCAAGGVPAVVALLGCPDRKAQSMAAFVLLNIAYHSFAADCVFAAGATDALVRCLHQPCSDEGLVNVVGALVRLAVLAAGAAAALAGCRPLLVQLLRSSSNEAVCGQLAVALSNLSFDSPATAAACVADGVVPPLARLLHVSGNELVLDYAARAVGNPTKSADTAAAFAAAGCIPDLVRLLRTCGSVGALDAAVAALFNLANFEPDLAATIEAAGGRAALLRHGASGDPDLRADVATALAKLDQHAMHSVHSTPPAAAAERQEQQQQPAAPRVCAAEGCTSTAHLRRCSGCGRVRYCGVACHNAHWRAHRRECRRWQEEARGGLCSGGTGCISRPRIGCAALTRAASPARILGTFFGQFSAHFLLACLPLLLFASCSVCVAVSKFWSSSCSHECTHQQQQHSSTRRRSGGPHACAAVAAHLRFNS